MQIDEFAERIIEGPGGMNAFERDEYLVIPYSDRVAAAIWTIRCLANPDCEGSDEAVKAILDRRGQPPVVQALIDRAAELIGTEDTSLRSIACIGVALDLAVRWGVEIDELRDKTVRLNRQANRDMKELCELRGEVAKLKAMLDSRSRAQG